MDIFDMIMLGMFSEPESGFEEIRKLDRLLTEADIPHEFEPHLAGGYRLTYYGPEGRPKADPGVLRGFGVGAVCSAIDIPGSYGHERGLIEIHGLITKEEYEKTHDTVLGDLTAEDVFARIHKHWTEATKENP